MKRPIQKALPARYRHVLDPDWHRRTIGNVPNWDYMGKLQLDSVAGLPKFAVKAGVTSPEP